MRSRTTYLLAGLFFISISIFFAGCVSTSNNSGLLFRDSDVMKKREDNKEATSIITGIVRTSQFSLGQKAGMVKKDNEATMIRGAIISMNDSTVIFDPEKEGLFKDDPAAPYNLSELACVVDSAGTLLRGTLPAKFAHQWEMSWLIVPAD